LIVRRKGKGKGKGGKEEREKETSNPIVPKSISSKKFKGFFKFSRKSTVLGTANSWPAKVFPVCLGSP